MKENTKRLQFLDSLRFFAALAVIIQHTFERISPQFGWFCSNYFQFGAFGVCLFFLCSGFIIPVSIEKHQSIKKFAISRIYRLYPIFLVSLVLKISLILHGDVHGVDPSLTNILANVSMLAKFIGQPLIEASYWTLNLEMAFYIIVAILFKLNLLKHSVALAGAGLLGVSLIGIVGIHILHLFDGGWLLAFYLATMFVGTLYYRYLHHQLSKTALQASVATAIVTLVMNSYFVFGSQVPNPKNFGGESFLPVTNAILTAYLLFTVCYYFRNKSYPQLFTHLGAISYSLYLNQAIILTLVLSNIPNPVLASTLAISLTFIVSNYTYKYIEVPFINASKRIISAPKPAENTTSKKLAKAVIKPSSEV